MSYVTEIFKRLNIQNIREFLLHGCDEINVDSRSYEERLEKPEKVMRNMLHDQFPEEKEYEEVTNKIYDYASACEEVYMEIGLQCGFVLAMEIVANTKARSDDEKR